MVDLSIVDTLTIPEGPVASIQVDGHIIWRCKRDRISSESGIVTSHLEE